MIATSTDTEPESAKNTRSRPAGAISDEPLGKADGGLMREPAEHHVRHASSCSAQRGVERGVAVAVDGAPPRRHAVDQLASVGQTQAYPLGGQHRQGGCGGGQRRVGVPHALTVEREQFAQSLSVSPRTG